MIKVTVVFYQFPVAMHELNSWQKSVDAQKEVIDDKGRIIYTVRDKNDVSKTFEKLFCFDVNNFSIDEVQNVLYRNDIHLKTESYVYNKTLIFGKVTLLNLLKVQRAIEQFEL